jgi:hypothetical protein
VNGDGVPVVPRDNGGVDDTRSGLANSTAWSLTSFLASCDAGWRPEARRRRFASVDDACVDSLRKWIDKVHQRERRDERER